MSMRRPNYEDNEEFLKWFDFTTGQFREGVPKEIVEMKEKEDAERELAYQKALQQGICL